MAGGGGSQRRENFLSEIQTRRSCCPSQSNGKGREGEIGNARDVSARRNNLQESQLQVRDYCREAARTCVLEPIRRAYDQRRSNEGRRRRKVPLRGRADGICKIHRLNAPGNHEESLLCKRRGQGRERPRRRG